MYRLLPKEHFHPLLFLSNLIGSIVVVKSDCPNYMKAEYWNRFDLWVPTMQCTVTVAIRPHGPTSCSLKAAHTERMIVSKANQTLWFSVSIFLIVCLGFFGVVFCFVAPMPKTDSTCSNFYVENINKVFFFLMWA